MINGVFIQDTGDVQVIGNVSSFAVVIKAMKQVLPQLEETERQRFVDQLSLEDLEKLIEMKKQ